MNDNRKSYKWLSSISCDLEGVVTVRPGFRRSATLCRWSAWLYSAADRTLRSYRRLSTPLPWEWSELCGKSSETGNTAMKTKQSGLMNYENGSMNSENKIKASPAKHRYKFWESWEHEYDNRKNQAQRLSFSINGKWNKVLSEKNQGRN